GSESEFRRLAAGRGPFAGPFGVKLGPQPDPGPHPDFLDTFDDHLELVELFDDYYHPLPDARTHHRKVDKGLVLEPVADEQRFGGLVQRERRVQFGFGAGFHSEAVFAALAQELLDDLPPGIHFHRKDAVMRTGVAELARSIPK